MWTCGGGGQEVGVGGEVGVQDSVSRALETCQTHHQFIASQAEHLERLRSQCATSAQLTQQEIRTLEEKLVKLFSLQLVTKRHLPLGVVLPSELQQYPSLKQWLQVVGLSKDSINGLCQRIPTLEALLEKRENEFRSILNEYGADRSEAHKLARAMQNLKRYTETQMQGQGGDWGSSDLPLYWDSWERSCPPSPRLSHRAQREGRSSVSSSDGDGGSVTSSSTSGGGAWSGDGSRTGGRGAPISQRSSDDSSTPSSPPPPFSSAPPPSSPGGPFHIVSSNLTLPGSSSVFFEKRPTPPPTPNIPKVKSSGDKKFPTTPPPGKKYQTCLLNPTLPLGRSTSHESQLAPRAEGHDHQSSTVLSMEHLGARRARLHSESEASGALDSQGKRTDSGRNRTDMQELKTAQNSPAPSTLASPIKSPNYADHIEEDNYSNTNVSEDPGDIPQEMKPLKLIGNRTLPKPPVSISSTQSDVIDSRQSHDSDRTVSQTSGSGSTGTDDSDRTIAGPGRVDSQDSTVSDGENADPRCTRQNSVTSVSQWDIPYDELVHGEVLGKGRFGIVYSGNWHGHVAIKELRMDYVNDEKTLEAFKAEVSTFRKTRHENLVLFMGACMKPPRLAIVTSLCKGHTLYTHIHENKDKFNMSKTIMIAQQISQGMGYLHARGIVHKDLKTKNIFLESGKVVITDFGLFNVTRLCHDSRTVWYELLCGEWPHKGLPPEAIIWQVGRGMKPSLANLQASRDVKDILMACWSYRPKERPEFSQMQSNLNRLPKKRLQRSPSHPIHLSRSAESVF
ncbi:Kinase suppressor of Ras 2 [Portunus trituberculatus]|uniref:Kinase suppressor of Ras 2 n=1 Tax=Portunus trituberculatus TaxID=210409 RepID=A0A5B7DTU7_PORTR|nr:Kinase suppressor of Ras 2 [Portunus trituberculatus]